MASRVVGSPTLLSVDSSVSSALNPSSSQVQLRLLRVSYKSVYSAAQSFGDAKGRSSHFMHGIRRVKKILPIVKCDVPDFSSAEPETDHRDLDAPDEPESTLPIFDDAFPSIDDTLPSRSSNALFYGTDGKSGFVSFYNCSPGKESKPITICPKKNPNNLQRFLGPTVLVTSFILPSFGLRRILLTIFENSLQKELITPLFIEATYYCGFAIFLILTDRMRRSMTFDSTNDYHRNSSQLGQRNSSITTLVFSLIIIIPMVGMDFVWPWTGLTAFAALGPYLVGVVVQLAFEQFAKYKKSPSLPVIPIIFQVYRLQQLNRAAQLMTTLKSEVRGCEVTYNSLVMINSLGIHLRVLRSLTVICIWSLSSFVMRYVPSPPPLKPSPSQSD